jgi:hypothetical protein
MTTITYGVCRANLGEVTSAQYRAYKTAAQAALEEAFPGSEIVIEDSSFANASTCSIGRGNDDISRDDVEEALGTIGEDWWEAD